VTTSEEEKFYYSGNNFRRGKILVLRQELLQEKNFWFSGGDVEIQK
jgi:hypothetical protein